MTTDYRGLRVSAATLEAWLQQYEKTIGGAPTDQDELARIRELRERVKAGEVWDEAGQTTQIGASAEWDASAVSAAAGDIGQAEADANRRKLMIFGGVMVALTLVACGLIFLPGLLRGGSAAASKTTPAPDSSASPVPTVALPVAVSAGNLKLAIDAPRSLEVDGVPYPVIPGKVNDSGDIVLAQIDPANPSAFWFPSPANWLMGLPESVILKMKVGDIITARTITGSVFRFVIDRLQDADPQQIELLAQSRAGMTLMPFPATTTPVRLVSAAYDPSGEKSIINPPDALPSTPLPIGGASIVVGGVSVGKQADNVYIITVKGQTTGTFDPPILEVGGQIYPAAAGIAPDSFSLSFTTLGLGNAYILVGGKRIGLGELQPPQLAGQLMDARLETPQRLTVTVKATVDGGARTLSPGDFALLTSQSSGNEGTAWLESPPTQLLPALLVAAPGEPVMLKVSFAVTDKDTSARVRVFDQVYEITLR